MNGEKWSKKSKRQNLRDVGLAEKKKIEIDARMMMMMMKVEDKEEAH